MGLHPALRGIGKLARVGLHLATGAATVAFVYPRSDRERRLSLKRQWSRKLLRVLDIECRVKGGAPGRAALIVANHTSWIDIFAINAVAPAAFVCKEEVRRWPLIGWLCVQTDTIFLRRGSRRAARDVAGQVERALAEGRTVAVFPEGTTSPGGDVLPFHAALLQPAIGVQGSVQPIALRYCDGEGQPTSCVAYWGDMSFMESLWKICCSRDLRADVHILPPVGAAHAKRHTLAEEARNWIAAGLGAPAFHTRPNADALVVRGLPVVTISA